MCLYGYETFLQIISEDILILWLTGFPKVSIISSNFPLRCNVLASRDCHWRNWCDLSALLRGIVIFRGGRERVLCFILFLCENDIHKMNSNCGCCPCKSSRKAGSICRCFSSFMWIRYRFPVDCSSFWWCLSCSFSKLYIPVQTSLSTFRFTFADFEAKYLIWNKNVGFYLFER